MYLSDIGDSPHRNIIHCLCGTLHNYYELNFTNYLINMYYTIYCNTQISAHIYYTAHHNTNSISRPQSILPLIRKS